MLRYLYWSEDAKFQLAGGISSRDTVSIMVMTVNNNSMLCTWKLLTVDFKCSHKK